MLKIECSYATLLHNYTITQLHSYTATQACKEMVYRGIVMSEGRNMVNLTLTVTRDERKALKQLALDNDTTVSSLLRMWLKEHIEKEKTRKE